MQIFKQFAQVSRRVLGTRFWSRDDCHSTAAKLRACRYEHLEKRNPMAADLHFGAVYFEGDVGEDVAPDYIQVTFEGGAEGTQLTKIVINGDKNGDGQYSAGELFFDTVKNDFGAFGAAPFKIEQIIGNFTVTGWSVDDGGQSLTIDLDGFNAGEKLIFSIDVDEVQELNPDTGQPEVNAIVEGAEFQNSILSGYFKAPHYHDLDVDATPLADRRFKDAFDARFAQVAAATGSTLDLPPDSHIPPSSSDHANRTAGAAIRLVQSPLPITLAGTVYHDRNLNQARNAGEEGIAGVQLKLFEWNGSQWVNTGKIETTDAQGNYKFEGLLPGTYRVMEAQPAGWLSVGSQAGMIDGATVGTSVNPDMLSDIVLLGGQDGVKYNFGEALPGSIMGRVHADPEGDCNFGPNDIPLEGVRIDLLDEQGNLVETTFTDANGVYKFDNLAPGSYTVFEHQPAGYFDAGEHVGTVDGAVNGTVGGDDLLKNIVLLSDQHGINYDFCENIPNSISGRVHADPEGDCNFGPNDIPLEGVRIDLLDASGKVIDTTFTGKNGRYKFENLAPGTYGIREHQPAGYFDAGEHVGTVGGVSNGVIAGDDLITHIVLLSDDHGIRYDFCENIPNSISGYVHADPEGDCEVGPNDIPLEGVRIDLLDASGKVIDTTFTDKDGFYKFDNLPAGEYQIREHQPAGYFDSGEHVGTVNGATNGQLGGNDLIEKIVLLSGDHGIHYDFCENIPNSISGYVHADPEGDCEVGPNDIPLQGVRIDLLDKTGKLIDTTFTDKNGFYKFDNLPAGEYQIREHQPAGYFDSGEHVGTVNGVKNGVLGGNDLIKNIVLVSADQGVHYDFCENIPNSISGYVHADPEGDCEVGPHDIPLEGVRVDLFDKTGKLIDTTFTDKSGFYKFDNLPAGEYQIREHQPAGYFDSGEHVGTVNGKKTGKVGGDDWLKNIVLLSDDHGVQYNFCENLPNSIRGRVHADPEGDCEFGPNDIPLEGVRIDLLDASGKVIDTTFTDKDGFYEFKNLAPGTYGVYEHQPADFLNGGTSVGSLGGKKAADDLITQIEVLSDDHGVNYDFCEHIPVGKISGYVFQDGQTLRLFLGQEVPPVAQFSDGVRTPDDTAIAGVQLQLVDQSGNVIATTTTNARGFYEFDGLAAGTYTVRQIHPAGYIDGIDTPGTTGGSVGSPDDDVIASISVAAGQHSRENNFSEVRVEVIPPPVENPPPEPVIPALAGGVPPIVPRLFLPTYVPQTLRPYLDGSGAVGYTWHLSIIDAGYPRGGQSDLVAMHLVSAPFDVISWFGSHVGKGEWILQDVDGNETRRRVIGLEGAIPLAGDFNGDGVVDLGLYYDGHWFLDLDGDGQWDDTDLWAKLGTRDDKPVVGDWNGDGKDDIGIFGPAWPRDPRAIEADPGMPDPLNKIAGKKNVPPKEEEAALGERRLRFASQPHERTDLIDHVFHFGTAIDRPVVGDWTGNGLRRIGIFYNGMWYLDMDGDGRWSPGDVPATFGRAGDIPVVGDWTGDGVEKIGIYRDGQWILDTNGNFQEDAEDRVVQLGQPGDKPVVGDFSGTGRSDIGVYRAASDGPAKTAAVPAAAEVEAAPTPKQ